jgi:hypothetical protein
VGGICFVGRFWHGQVFLRKERTASTWLIAIFGEHVDYLQSAVHKITLNKVSVAVREPIKEVKARKQGQGT